MTYTKITRTFVATMALGFAALIGGQANASDYRQLEDLALEIQRATSQLSREVNHYKQTPQYRHLRDDTRQLRRLARHIRSLTRRPGNLHHIRKDLGELVQTYHHIERVFDRAEASANCGVSQVRGNTVHVKFLLKSIERMIHRMQADVRFLTRPVCGIRPHAVGFDLSYGGQFQNGNRGVVPQRSHRGHHEWSRTVEVPRRGVQFDRRAINLGSDGLGFRINF